MLLVGAADGDAPLITANAVTFDGSNDVVTRGAALTGGADNSRGIFSCWIYRSGSGATQRIFATAGGFVFFEFDFSNRLSITLVNAAGTVSLSFVSTSAISSGAWHSLVISWDTNFSAGNKLFHCYLDDSSVAGTKIDAGAAFNVAYEKTNWSVGATDFPSQYLNGRLSEVYFAMGQYLDFSVTANRRKFLSATNKPVSLGSDGSLPTSVQPTVYLNNGAATFGTNKGSGGNFTITGTLDTSPTSPSD